MKLGSCLSSIIVGSGDSKGPGYERGSWHVPVSVTLGNWFGLAWSQGEAIWQTRESFSAGPVLQEGSDLGGASEGHGR